MAIDQLRFLEMTNKPTKGRSKPQSKFKRENTTVDLKPFPNLDKDTNLFRTAKRESIPIY